MTQQFTASEVRELAKHMESVGWRPDSKGTPECYDEGAARSAEILFAFADLLEAREKAGPVAYAEFADNGCVRMWSLGYEERLPGTRMIPLYTHPADAERLAEALREIAEFDCGCVPCVGERRKGRAAEIELQARMEIAQEALAVHSAQAVKALGSLGLTEEQQDAIRFRALCADYGDRAIRAKVRGLIDRLPVMSLSAARSAIDDLTRNIAQPKIGDFDARDSFTVHTNTTTLQQNAAEGAQAQPPAARVPEVTGLTWEPPNVTVDVERVGRFRSGDEHIVRVTFRSSDDGRRMTCFYSANESAVGYLHAMLAAQENPNG